MKCVMWLTFKSRKSRIIISVPKIGYKSRLFGK